MKTSRLSLRMLMLLAADIALVALEFLVLQDTWRSSGTNMLRYYTHDSNLFALAVSFICALSTVYSLISGKKPHRLLKSLRLTAASGLMVTFLVCIFILGPLNGGPSISLYIAEIRSSMLEGSGLYLHTVCPLLLCFSFLFLEDAASLPRSHALLILPSTILYGAVTLFNNYTRAYSGPYPFFHVYRQPAYMTALWCVLILLGAWLISLGVLRLNRLIGKTGRPSGKG